MKKLKLHHWILVAMLLGAGIGFPVNVLAARGDIDPALAEELARDGEALGTLFLKLLKMVVVPLIVSSIITGVTGLGDPRHLGRLGARTVAYYLSTSFFAIVVGIGLTNLIGPGRGVTLSSLTPEEAPQPATEARALGEILWDQLTGMIPDNPIQAAAEGDMLPIIFFSLLFGLFVTFTGGEHGKRVADLFASLFEVMMKLTVFVVHLAPVGVFGFMIYASAGFGIEAFYSLAMYMLTVVLGLSIHAFLTLPALLFVFARRSPLAFAKAMTPALLTAFSTASSNATLPLTMSSVETRAGVSSRVSSFVLPLGATINMDGTALYEVVAVLFIAQVYGGDLSIAQQVVVAVTALLASIGAAGIPHAGTVMMVVVLDAVGLPVHAVGLILAVDRVLDMFRTSVNVWSDATAAAVMARYEADEVASATDG